jgi:glutamyl-tRNA synthetase
LHIGGVRTALFNYLFAKKHGGQFLLRVEDTDQTRFVPGAEDYIIKALNWLGIQPDESPVHGGPCAPYRQSDRKEAGIYQQYAEQMIRNGHAYYAFDTAEELAALRSQYEAQGQTFKYDARTRLKLNNSLTLSPEAVAEHLANKSPYVIRIKLPQGEIVKFSDLIRGEVSFNSDDLDDKVLMKEDGMPTYHLANVVDDYLMKITHVTRGEEWLPSTPLHVYLYRFLGWESVMPQFAHLPLILRPDGKGKLSKRDGAKFGIPVFPLDWAEQGIMGFDGWGFLPHAVLNFLVQLGWSHPEGKDLLSLEEMVQAFDFAAVHKGGARFDFDKAKWFNQQYLMQQEPEQLAKLVQPLVAEKGYEVSADYLAGVCALLRGRVHFLKEIPEKGCYFFQSPDYGKMMELEGKELEKKVLKKWDDEKAQAFAALPLALANAENKQEALHSFMEQRNLKAGEVMPVLRLALTGTLQGPDVVAMLQLFPQDWIEQRLKNFLDLLAGLQKDA